MTVIINLASLSSLEKIIPNIQISANSALWISPQEFHFTGKDITTLFEAFSELRGIFWYSTTGMSLSARINDHKRAFGSINGLEPQLVKTTTIEYFSTNEDDVRQNKIYSDVAMINTSSSESLAELLAESTFGITSILSFIPNNIVAAKNWSNVISGLDWLWLSRGDFKNGYRNLPDAHSIIKDYLAMTLQLEGIPGIVYSNSETKKGLIFVGDKRLLEKAADYLLASSDKAQRIELEDIVKRGVFVRMYV